MILAGFGMGFLYSSLLISCPLMRINSFSPFLQFLSFQKKIDRFIFLKKILSTARRIYTRIDYNETSASLFLVRNVKQFLNVVIFSVIII
jgi:hypothetical protein